MEPAPEPRVTVVVATRDRASSLRTTLDKLTRLPERPAVVVVDNGSSDGTVEIVERDFPGVEVIALEHNAGAAARTVGATHAGTPYVGFSDDDSWWAPGALPKAADLLDAHPRLALVAGTVLLGPERRPEPACVEMATSPLPQRDGLPGTAILGFVACGAVLRRAALLEVGGFDGRFGVGGEEELLAIDLAAAGWGLSYVGDLVAYHFPSPRRDDEVRRRLVVRNALWVAWLRRRLTGAALRTAQVVGPALVDGAARAGVVEALRGLPWIVHERRSVSRELERALRLLVD